MFLVLLLVLPLVSAKCPLNAVDSTEYGTCYLIASFSSYWSAAEGICQNLGGHLASIKDQQQNDYIYKLVQANYGPVWLGANVVNTQWTYSDGTAFTYSNFQNGSLNNQFKHTVAFMTPFDRNGTALNGTWQYANDDVKEENLVLCSVSSNWNDTDRVINICRIYIVQFPIPHCLSDGSAPQSLLNSTNPAPGLVYGDLTQSWYYGTPANAAKLEAAQLTCASMGGNLPTVFNAYQNSQLLQIARKFKDYRYLALGFVCSDDGVWSWLDGSNSTYTNWAPFQPSDVYLQNTLMDCQTGLWDSIDEFNHVPFICEFSQNQRNFC